MFDIIFTILISFPYDFACVACFFVTFVAMCIQFHLLLWHIHSSRINLISSIERQFQCALYFKWSCFAWARIGLAWLIYGLHTFIRNQDKWIKIYLNRWNCDNGLDVSASGYRYIYFIDAYRTVIWDY